VTTYLLDTNVVVLSQGVTHILTLITADFDGLPGITALNPSAIPPGG
jgi:hypothetical protein